MSVARWLVVGLVSLAVGVFALGVPGLDTEQASAQESPMERGQDRPVFDPETQLWGYPTLGIKPQFSHALPFSEDGLARVLVGCRHADCSRQSPGFNEARKRAWAYIDTSFRREPGTYDVFDPSVYVIYDEDFEAAASFSEDYRGLARVKVVGDPHCHLINTTGETVFSELPDGRVILEPTRELIDFLVKN